MRILEGELQAKGLKFAVVVSRFNEFITSKLLDGTVDALTRHGGGFVNLCARFRMMIIERTPTVPARCS